MLFHEPATHPNFTLLDQRPLPIWGGTGVVYRHTTGANVLSICNQDPNKTFGIFFPTPPATHTGLPHILEHSVLCGSARYPVKEPFKELLKTSLQTFLNAFTYPDRTCYPVASQNLRDFYNLMDVYLDAVFHPRLTPAVLGQEGWRLQPDTDHKAWEIQGVVYNEMKGAYASADARLETLTQKEMFPDTCYRWDYGGDPAEIPNLGFEEFEAFHQAHYHPANAWMGCYGNDDPAVRLEKIDQALQGLEPGPLPPPAALQNPWSEPRRVTSGYPASAESDEGVFVQLAWLLPGETSDSLHMQIAGLASSLLLNSPSSPLRLALLDSGLGDDLIGGPGFHLRQPMFAAGLKGVEPGHEAEVTACINRCLEQIAEEGFRPDLVEGVLTLSEFQMKELNTSNKGLWSLLSSVQPWLYGGDPLEALDSEPRLEEIRRRVTADPRFFADWIRHHLVENPSRLEVVLTPDSGLAAVEREQEAALLAAMTQELETDQDRRDEVEALAAAVHTFQETPDSPEDLATLPQLALADMEPLPPPPGREELQVNGVEVTTTDVASNGIVYFQFAFDLSHLETEDLHLLPLYSRCLTELGTKDRDQFVFNEQLACHTGGISVNFETSATYHGTDLEVMILKLKCLLPRLDAASDLLADVFAHPLLGPPEKVMQLLLEERANEEADLQVSGNQVVSLRLKAGFSPSERTTEEMDGVAYLMALRNLETRPPEELHQRLRSLHQKVCTRSRVRAHVGGDDEARRLAHSRLERLLSALPEAPRMDPVSREILDMTEPQGLTLSSPVHYVGLGTRLEDSEATRHFSHFVAQRLLNTDFLWEQVRMQGGAYGCSSSFSHLERTMIFTSYRDPHLTRTLDLYRKSGTWLQQLEISTDALEQTVIGTLGKLSPPERPSTLVTKSFFRHLIGLEHDTRQRFWDDIHQTTPRHLHAFGRALTEALQQTERLCVLGNADGQKKSGIPFRSLQLL